MFLYFGCSTILLNSGIIGNIGKIIGGYFVGLFGSLASFIIFFLMFCFILVFKIFNKLNLRLFTFLSGIFLFLISLIIAQSVIPGFLHGSIGVFLSQKLNDSIGLFGIWMLVIVFFVLSFILIFEDKFLNFIKYIFSLLNFSEYNIGLPKFGVVEELKYEISYFYNNFKDFIKRKFNEYFFENKKDEEENDYYEKSYKKQNYVESEIKEEVDNKKDEFDFSSLENEISVMIENPNSILERKTTLNSSKTNIENIKKDEDIELKFDESFKDDEIKKIDEKPVAIEKAKKVEHLKEVEENKRILQSLEFGKFIKPKDFKLPPMNFLNSPVKKTKNYDEVEIDKKIVSLLEKLKTFKIDGDIIRTYSGPVVTTFEFKPAPNVKVSRILGLQNDLAMTLRAQTIRIQAPVPGKDVVGIEIPNNDIETIYLREILESDIFKKASSPLTIALGKDIVGKPFVTDLRKLPHLLIAGTTGSGKSVGVNSMLVSLLYRNSPKTLRLVMIDPKVLEFSVYNDIPHLLTPVITEPKKAITALSNLVNEMDRRYRLMAEISTKNIENYNEKITKSGGEILPYIVVIIDELADLMMTAGKDAEFYIARLAQMARASGIHLIVATQRPSVNVVTGLIKTNLPSRLSFRVGTGIDSKVILDQTGAESLLGRGDMLFTPPSNTGIIRLHAPFVDEFEIEKIVEFLKHQQPVVYDESFLSESNSGGGCDESEMSEDLKDLYEQAKTIMINDGKTSISYIQRRLGIGYNKAADIVEEMERRGFLSKPNSKGIREILD